MGSLHADKPLHEVEKEDDDLSVHSSSFSSHHSAMQQSDVQPTTQYMSMTAKEDSTSISANPDGASQNGKLGVKSLRVLTRTSTKSSWKDPGPPPDGGLKAWLQVACAHLVIMCTWGLINSFGVFQTYYVTYLSRPPSDIAWIGSFQVFLTFFIGTFTGRLTDAGYFRSIFFLGSILNTLGIMMASLSTQYWQLFLAQGVCTGLGNGCLFCPMLALVSTYFSKKKSLAIGIAAAGSATGGLVFPVMVQQLLPKIGFGWTMRSLGFTVLGCLAICNAFARQRLPPRRAGPLVEWSAFKDTSYTLFAVGMFFNFWGVYFAFFYLSSFARLPPISLPYTTSLNLLLVLNGLGYVGRLLPNHLADRSTGPLNILIPVTLITSICMFSMLAVTTTTALYIWAVFYGIFGAAIQSLFPAVLSSLTTDLRKAGVRMGMIFTIVSFAVLTGPPIEGALIAADGERYVGAQCFAGASMMLGAVALTAARVGRTGWVWRVKM